MLHKSKVCLPLYQQNEKQMQLHNTNTVQKTLEVLSTINELIQSADQKAEMLKESLRHSHPFMSDKGKRKMYQDIDITISAKLRLVQRFNNLKFKNL